MIGQSGETHPPRKSSRDEDTIPHLPATGELSWQTLPCRCPSQTNPFTNYFRTCVWRRSQALYLRQTSRPRV